jgi:DNA-binding transcriptional ArsR family regulator
MPGPNLAMLLNIREKELESQISVMRGHLKPMEEELAQVRKIKQFLADAREAGLTELTSEATLPPPVDPDAKITIKEMILAALRDHFHDGASPTELSDYMKSAYGKDVDRNSISPQLSRLKEEGMVDMLSNGKWKLSRHGLGILRYGNQPPRKYLAAGDMTLGDVLHNPSGSMKPRDLK